MNLRQAAPSIVTVLAMICGFVSILVTCESLRVDNPLPLHVAAAQLIMLAAMLDGLDGNVARALKVESKIGAALDSHADIISFGVAPAVLVFGVMHHSGNVAPIWWAIPIAMVLSGMLRLARFAVTDPDESKKGFTGLPIPVCACWVSVVVYISQSGHGQHSWLFDLSSHASTTIFAAGIMLMAILQISNVRYPKPSKNMMIFAPLMLLVVIFVAAGKGPFASINSDWSVRSAIAMLFIGSSYIFLGPPVVISRERRLARREAGGRELPDDDDEF